MTLMIALFSLFGKWTCKHVQNSLREICITVDYLSIGLLTPKQSKSDDNSFRLHVKTSSQNFNNHLGQHNIRDSSLVREACVSD